MTVAVVISLLLWELLACVSCEICPPPEDISPCNCSGAYMLKVDCKGGSWKEIYEAFGHLRRKNFYEVKFWNVTGDRLPSDLFRHTHVKILRIESCDLQNLSDMDGRLAFEDLEKSLMYLYVVNSIKGANQLKTLDLSHLKRLLYLFLIRNNIPEVGNDWFANGPLGLEKITIASCGMSKIGDAAFAHLVNLEHLGVAGNRLTAIERSMFPNPAPELGSLFLHKNNFTGLSDDIFSEMPSLDTVILRGNSIRRIEEATWSPVWEKLHTLDIFSNPLECDIHMKWLSELKQPDHLSGRCSSPEAVKVMQLKDFIEGNIVSSPSKL